MFAHKRCGFQWVRGALRDLLPPLPSPCLLPVLAPLTWPHRLHQHDAVPTDSEAKAMLVLLDDDAALDQTWGGRGGTTSKALSLGGRLGLWGVPATLFQGLWLVSALPSQSWVQSPWSQPACCQTPKAWLIHPHSTNPLCHVPTWTPSPKTRVPLHGQGGKSPCLQAEHHPWLHWAASSAAEKGSCLPQARAALAG